MSVPVITIGELSEHVGNEVTVRGWVFNWRKKGKLRFIILRDGFGYLQCVVFRPEVDEPTWDAAVELTQESSLEVRGVVARDDRAPGGYELKVTGLTAIQVAPEYPIGKKDHGVDFLLSHRHLWLRSKRQHAVLRVRSELEMAIRDFFHGRGYTLIDSPILTPAACEGTSTLFQTDYFGDQAFLSQSGQLYLEPAAAAFGKVYCFGPTFRAEKSKTRRHLTEFWMVEPEVAWMRFDGLLELAEEFLSEIVARILDRCSDDLERLERDTSLLEPATKRPYPRIDYADAIQALTEKGYPTRNGDDFGAEEETALASLYDRPVMVTRYPAAIKAFYMQPDPDDQTRALAVDVLAPEGYGEIIGGSERSDSLEHLERQIASHDLPKEAFEWYLDVRRYGSFPHSGFGMGIERCVSWLCGIHHLREAIPYPRTLNRIYP
ncbi:MAG: asparagine--tRNA ligase [Acidobacteria bacterium]|jgi:asparaginyl-tRNA synthetase|nr:asparagine--tRNA ligase [Acidobacteriota bacterium]